MFSRHTCSHFFRDEHTFIMMQNMCVKYIMPFLNDLHDYDEINIKRQTTVSRSRHSFSELHHHHHHHRRRRRHHHHHHRHHHHHHHHHHRHHHHHHHHHHCHHSIYNKRKYYITMTKKGHYANHTSTDIRFRTPLFLSLSFSLSPFKQVLFRTWIAINKNTIPPKTVA